MRKIDRRQAIKKASLIMGSTLSASVVAGFLSGCEADPALDWEPRFFNTKQALIAADLAERILPATDTPGAKEALADRFIDTMLAEFLLGAERKSILEGLDFLSIRRFTKKSPDQQDELISELVAEARKQGDDTETKPFFLLFKELTLLGFFTSEVGATRVLNYDPTPGVYQGCRPLTEVGGKTWAL